MWSQTLIHECEPGFIYQWHELVLTEQIEWMTVSLEHSGSPWPYVFLWDAQGALRLQCLSSQSGTTMVITTATTVESGCGCSPGCVSGPLPTGVWHVLFIAHPTPHRVRYSIVAQGDIGLPARQTSVESREVGWAIAPQEAGTEFRYNMYDRDRVVQSGERWYRGDLHMHTLLSDGKLTARELSNIAQQRGLDFIAITEHNILTTAWVQTPLLVMPGVEYTSTRGHWNAIGLRESIPLAEDAGPILETQEGMNRLIGAARMQGALCSLNHPCLKPWDWTWEDTPLQLFHTIEIVNDPTFPGNREATEQAIRMLDGLWACGHKVWGIGGSDTHMLPTESYTEGGPPSIVGDPTTCVWALQLSAESILSAVRSGHSYVTRGPELDPKILTENDAVHRPGDSIRALRATDSVAIELLYSLQIKHAPSSGRILWVENGNVVETTELSGEGVYMFRRTWPISEYHWLRVEVRDAAGWLAAFVNPVYVDGTKETDVPIAIEAVRA